MTVWRNFEKREQKTLEQVLTMTKMEKKFRRETRDGGQDLSVYRGYQKRKKGEVGGPLRNVGTRVVNGKVKVSTEERTRQLGKVGWTDYS